MFLWLSRDDRERLRTALALGETVQALKRSVTNVELEWSEVLDKLRASEERARKRHAVAIRKGAESRAEGNEVADVQTGGDGSESAPGGDIRATLWRRRRALEAGRK